MVKVNLADLTIVSKSVGWVEKSRTAFVVMLTWGDGVPE